MTPVDYEVFIQKFLTLRAHYMLQAFMCEEKAREAAVEMVMEFNSPEASEAKDLAITTIENIRLNSKGK